MWSFERRWAVAALEGFAPANGPGAAAGDKKIDYAGTLQSMLEGSTPLARLGMRLAILLVTLSPLFTRRSWHTLPALPLDQRAEQLDRLLSSPRFVLRELCLLLKIVAGMALLAPGALRDQTHFDAPRPSHTPAAQVSAQPDATRGTP